jgi:cob(I)alamin adenosyltransferase
MSKGDELAEALGSVDELNSWLGYCRSLIFNLKFEILNQYSNPNLQFKNIQTNLLTIGAVLAGSPSPRLRKSWEVEVKKLEKEIDRMTKELPKLANFIYPVGPIQVARSVCRRAERAAVRIMIHDSRFMNKTIIKYLNRLGDYLFVLARWVNFKAGIPEEVWKQ